MCVRSVVSMHNDLTKCDGKCCAVSIIFLTRHPNSFLMRVGRARNKFHNRKHANCFLEWTNKAVPCKVIVTDLVRLFLITAGKSVSPFSWYK